MTTLVSAEATAPPVISAPAAAQGAAAHGTAGQGSASQDKGLRAGALGLLSSVVIAVSSTAPAYSMAATLGLIVAVVGVHSPGTLIVSFLPMLCIAYAFRELNKADPDCGTTFTWTARAFGPRAGWMGGWGIIAADVIVMASLAQIAGRYFMQLVGLQGAGTVWVTVSGVAFIALLTAVCYRGIEVSARLQQVLLIIEVGALAIFAVVALVKAGTGHALPGAAHPSAAWLSPWTGSFGSLSNSFLLAVFIYWGWDCALSVNEETKDSARTPGRAAVMSTVMPTARAVLAMSAHGAIGKWFARMHPRFRTPTTATLVMGGISALFYVLLTAASKNVLADSAASVGLLIAFYYGLTAFACVWFFRRSLFRSVRDLITKGILPLIGGLSLLGAFVLSIKSYWPAASSYSSFGGVGGIFLIGAGSLVVGVVVMFITARFQRNYFAHGIATRDDA